MMKQSLPSLLRAIASLSVIAGVALIVVAVLKFSGAVTSVEAIGVGIGLLAMGGVCLGIAELVAAFMQQSAGDPISMLQALRSQLNEAQRRIDDIAVNTDKLSRTRPATVDGVSSEPAMNLAQQIREALQPALAMLTEIRDLSLLTDEERQQRLAMMDEERTQVLLRDATEHIEHHRFAQADHLLLTLEREHGNDPEVRRTRHYFNDARRNAEVDAVNAMREQVEQFLNISAYDKAHDLAARLNADYPGSVVAQSLINRVTLERDTFNEGSIARMIDELRHDVERKLWRRALMHLHHLVEKYPEHPKVKRVSHQLSTVRANAEIEERQELEVRIQELIRTREFGEAIQLSEELLRRYPTSPQAEAIETLLPRIRELAREDQVDVAAPTF